MYRCANICDLDKVIGFYDIAIEENNKSEINLRWQKNVHPSHKLIKTSIENKELFVYEENDEIIGALIMNKLCNKSYDEVLWGIDVKKEETRIIHVLAVHPRIFGRGVAKKLLSGAIEHCKNNNIKAIRLDVFKINIPAINLYKKTGFIKRAELRMYVDNIGYEDFELYEYIVHQEE